MAQSPNHNNHTNGRRDKPQYYYFYGSTEERNRRANGPVSPVPGSNDQDSLVGESLVATDNEHDDEMPMNESADRPHVVLMKGNEVQSLISNSNNKKTNGQHHHGNNTWQPMNISKLQRSHPIAFVTFLAGGLSLLCFGLALLIVQVNKEGANQGAPSSQTKFTMPFPTVDRSQFGDPVSAFLQKDLFHPKLLYRGSERFRDFIFPFPTGAFWTNLVLPPTADRGLSYPVAVYPYAYKWSNDLLQVSYPARHRFEEPKAIHDYFFPDMTFSAKEPTSQRYVQYFDPLSVTLRFNTMSSGYWETYLVQGSPYITIQYNNASPVVRAFSTFRDFFCPRDEDGTIHFDGSRRRRLSFGVCSSETSEDGSTETLRGIQFVIQSAEDMYWFVFASEPITLVLDKISRTTLSSESAFSGVLRFAYIPSALRAEPTKTTSNSSSAGPGVDVKVSSSKALQRLIYHAGVYPVAGSVSWSFRPASTTDTTHAVVSKSMTGFGGLPSMSSTSSGNFFNPLKSPRIGTIRFDYRTKNFAPASSSKPSISLLMLALPHHAKSLPESSKLNPDMFNLAYKCVKGPMTPVLGSTWSYDEILPSLGFDGDSGSNGMETLLDPIVSSTILESLKGDIKLALPTMSENVYGFGKQSARLAQIAHIAHTLMQKIEDATGGDTTNDTMYGELSAVLQEAVSVLLRALEHFLTNKVADSLMYDANLGGLVSSDGLLDSGADFGNGRYNDHHFHYGYLLYACAVLGNLNSTFVERFGNEVDSIYYDVAHDGNSDSRSVDSIFFPLARHKMWFDGHSFASGMFPFGNGKSQESSSEAVNCYYGAYLWSLVRHGAGSDPDSDTSAQTDFARLLLATEIRGARTYWHMSPSRSKKNQTESLPITYNPEFSENYMVGNLGMLDAVCSTWFGTDNLYVHMINFIPLTSITGELFSQQYVSEEYVKVFKPRGEVEMAWRGYVVADLAIIDANSAWRNAQALFSPELDSGLSKSQVFYWIATRSGFSLADSVNNSYVNVPRPNSKSAGSPASKAKGVDQACNAHSACTALGLVNDCCPTSNGMFLDCCNQ